MIDSSSILKNIAYFRREYASEGLYRKNLPQDPFNLFSLWLNQAIIAKIPEPTAMSVATVDEHGQPYQRMVLLKQFDQNGMVFYTNLNSRKAKQLETNKQISLLFPWYILERQVIILGKAESVSMLEVKKYFQKRPRNSQLAAWSSRQSSKIYGRKEIENNFLKFKSKFENEEIPLPKFWGGFRIKIKSMEFWQGREHRLHDRFFYHSDRNHTWKINRLAP